MRRTLRLLADLALTLGALVGVVCLLAGIGSVAFGVHPLIFRSGSMAPTIPAGAVAFARDVPASQIRVGDVVTVPWHSSRVTHRVVEVFHRHGSATLKLQGDANSLPDQDLYQVSSAPRVWFSVPVAGTVVAWLSRVPGVFVLAAYAALLLSIILRRSAPGGAPRGRGSPTDDASDEADQPVGVAREVEDETEEAFSEAPAACSVGPASRPRRRRASALLGVVACVLLLGIVSVPPTWGAWADTATVSGSSVSTYTVPTTTLSCGTLGVLSVTFNWTAVPSATSYTLHYGSNTLTTTSTTATITTAISGGTAWVNVNRNFGSTTWTSANSNTRTFTVAVVSLCT